MGIANAYLNQPNEERSISVELANALGIATEHPTIFAAYRLWEENAIFIKARYFNLYIAKCIVAMVGY